MKVEWSGAALADLNRFAQFLDDRFPSMAIVVGRKLIEHTKILAEQSAFGASFRTSA